MTASTSDLTELVERSRNGDRAAIDALYTEVYEELRRLARRQLQRLPSPNATLQTTGLVHEAYARLVERTRGEFRDPEHFLAVSARAMRHILIDLARRRGAEKRGGDLVRVDFEKAELQIGEEAPVLLAIDRALGELTSLNRRLVQVVECRFFAGLDEVETAKALGVSRSTVQRDWIKARGWLRHRLSDGGATRDGDPAIRPASSDER